MHFSHKPLSGIIKTSDGSNTLYNEKYNEHYHSINGAIQESVHVFIESGFKQVKKQNISILEIGFGTGLNCFLTYIESKQREKQINYTAIELYPITEFEIKALNYGSLLQHEDFYTAMHACQWNEWQNLSSAFKLLKLKVDIRDLCLNDKFDLVYFDAFSPNVQPELWTKEVFSNIHASLNPGGILTTYSAKGDVRRTLDKCTFKVERIPGPPGKREMIRAIKV
jgi:tRNA U34 5-methylaminomethyl-2-thiouridine-forming methyltransferase MnmC